MPSRCVVAPEQAGETPLPTANGACAARARSAAGGSQARAGERTRAGRARLTSIEFWNIVRELPVCPACRVCDQEG